MSIYNVYLICLVIITASFFFFFKQKTAYEMRISDWSSDVCSSDLCVDLPGCFRHGYRQPRPHCDIPHGSGRKAALRCQRQKLIRGLPAKADAGDRKSVV